MIKQVNRILCYLPLLLLLFGFSCRPDPHIPVIPGAFKTQNVVIVIMDGSRYTENFGDDSAKYTPNLHNLAKQGVLCTNFYCTGQTLTVPGHISLSTSVDEGLANNGTETPNYPSLFQMYLKDKQRPSAEAWIIASKDKIESLKDCKDPSMAGSFNPRTDCGISGNFSGYRADSTTFEHFMDTLSKYTPSLTLLSFSEPDVGGHSNNWLTYLDVTRRTDSLIKLTWDFLQSHPHYKNNTTMFVTNDHGRHSDGVSGGFSGHGDNCNGCRHIFLLGLGPDFPKGARDSHPYSLLDVAPTVAKLLKFKMHANAQGKPMNTLFPPEVK